VPRRGTYVVNLSRKDVVDLLQVRAELECLAASLAAKNITDSELSKMSNGLLRTRKMFDQHRQDGYPHHDIDFHQTVLRASGNSKVLQIMTGMYRQVRLVRLVSGAKASRAPQALDEHFAIFDALKEHDAKAAEHRMRVHLRASEQSILDTLRLQERAE
jgi:DNA-binding GntR family transcriptional regulator